METGTAFLLRRIRYSETSLILIWLTQEHGKIKTMAKGALRPKSAFAGRLDLFFHAEIGFARSRRSEIHTLRECSLLNTQEGLRKDYLRVEMASYFVALLDLATEPEHPEPLLYDLCQRGLGHLGEQTASLRALLHFEHELARLLGVHVEGAALAALERTLHRLPSGRVRLIEALG